jgi:peroxiredoxin
MLVVASLAAAAQEEVPGPAVGERFAHTLGAPDQTGQTRTLEALMGEKGSVVFFVRSADWCPYCQRQLADVNGRLSEFEALGLSVVSVSVDEVAEIEKFAEAQSIRYTMLADPQGAINEALGIRDPQYPVGSAAFGVPRPVLYVIDRSGEIRLRYMEPTYRTRPDLNVVLRDAAALDW